ncbi:MAG TPA: hypothetical protein VLF69_02990 [Candidatus Saccharimonadales bacterium]|nr:hypothetical protein [Candidatus Saccharimonadales bacterium]
MHVLIDQVLRRTLAVHGYYVPLINLDEQFATVRFIEQLYGNKTVKLCLNRLIIRPFLFDDTCVN